VIVAACCCRQSAKVSEEPPRCREEEKRSKEEFLSGRLDCKTYTAVVIVPSSSTRHRCVRKKNKKSERERSEKYGRCREASKKRKAEDVSTKRLGIRRKEGERERERGIEKERKREKEGERH
jgi:hypothetical protein